MTRFFQSVFGARRIRNVAQYRQSLFEVVRANQAIGVDKCEKLSPGQFSTAVPQCAHGDSGYLLYPRSTRVFLAENFVGAVVGTVVQHDQLSVAIALHRGKDGIQTAA